MAAGLSHFSLCLQCLYESGAGSPGVTAVICRVERLANGGEKKPRALREAKDSKSLFSCNFVLKFQTIFLYHSDKPLVSYFLSAFLLGDKEVYLVSSESVVEGQLQPPRQPTPTSPVRFHGTASAPNSA